MNRPNGIRPGDLVVSRNRKWNGFAHWVVPGRYLGEDECGHWLFQGTGEFISRPGAALYTQSDAVLLVPHTGDYAATFYDGEHPGGVRIYVDLALDFGWEQIRTGVFEFHMIDMDLDVIRNRDTGVYVDDEDEFAEHAAVMNYPPEVIERVQAECDRILAAVQTNQTPFDGRDAAWFQLGRA